MAQYKTPGGYIVEKNAFPNSVVEVATAVPAFIGHTQFASHKGESLTKKSWRIRSMAEFEACYGYAPTPSFTFALAGENDSSTFVAVPLVAAATTTTAAAVAVAAVAAAGTVTDPKLKGAADAAAKAEADAKTALDAATGDTKAALEETFATAQASTKAANDALAAATTAGTAGSTTAATAAALRKTADDLKTKLNTGTDAEKTAAAAAFKTADDVATAAEAAAAAAAVTANAAQLKTEAKRAATTATYALTRTAGNYLLYHSMQLFFQNGGGACYIVSVGDYAHAPDKDSLESGIDLLLKEQEPTMLVIPDAMLLGDADCYSLQQQMLMHCGYKMKNRFALLDVYNGAKELNDSTAPVNTFRDQVSSSFLAFGAAYYPWINTTIVAVKDLNFTHFDMDQRANLKSLLSNDLAPVLFADTTKNSSAMLKAQQVAATLAGIETDWSTAEDSAAKVDELHNTLVAISPMYNRVLLSLQRDLNLLPPSAAMAGLYTMVDNTRGVWKAPANVGLQSVTSPAVNITHDDQEDLNVSTTGKSINAIRSFIGEGTLVWGARTLDGNSLDWRYINVRRTMIMIEESLRLASKAYVFEPNVANTWVTIKSMARNFLTSVWKRGGLAGAAPDDAFSIAVGLNETMTADDILEGILRVSILVALSRPAEFIEITFTQQMQKS